MKPIVRAVTLALLAGRLAAAIPAESGGFSIPKGSAPGSMQSPRGGFAADPTRGRFYVADIDQTISVFDPSGKFLFRFDAGEVGGDIVSLAVDVKGFLYAAPHRSAGRIVRFDPEGRLDRIIPPELLYQPLDSFPSGIADLQVDSGGNIYILNLDLKAVQKLTADGREILRFPLDPKSFTQSSVALDERRNRLYVSDWSFEGLWVFDLSGRRLDDLRFPNDMPQHGTYGLRVAPDGDVYAKGDFSGKIAVLSPDGRLKRLFSPPGLPVFGSLADVPRNSMSVGPGGLIHVLSDPLTSLVSIFSFSEF